MKKLLLALSCAFVTVFSVQAVPVFTEDFSSGWSDGDINGVGGWVSAAGTTHEVVSGELMLDPSGGRLMFDGASANLADGESAKITVDYRVGGVSTRAHTRILSFGVQNHGGAAATNNANLLENEMFVWNADAEYRNSGQVEWWMDDQSWQGPGTYVLQAEPDLGWNPHGWYTNAVPYDNPALIDSESDDMRVVYTITKMQVSNEFNLVVSTTNLNGTAYAEGSHSGVVRSDVWNNSDVSFTIYSESQTNFIKSITMEKLDIAIDVPTSINSLGLDSQVDLSWDLMPGATNYLVYRTEISGDYTGVTPFESTVNSYSDATAVNGTTYYYSLAAEYPNGTSAMSDEVVVTPTKVFTDEPVYSDDFSGFAAGDMTQDADWSAVSGSGPNAFSIITTNSTYSADTVSTEADFDVSVGNAVYLDLLLSNEDDDAVEGSFDFKVTTTALPGQDADHSNWGAFAWGLTSSQTESLDVDKAVMALFHVTVRFENGVYILFGQDGNNEDDNTLAGFGWDDAGWNPKPAAAATASWLGDPAAAQDLETDLFRVNWEIRKTREAGVYQAWASMSNLTQNIAASGNIVFDTKSASELHDSPASLFTMGHYHKANDGVASSVLHATVDNVSLTHTVGNLPDVIAPVITTVTSIDRGVSLEWDSLLEATGYSVIMENGGNTYTVLDNTTDLVVTDKPRWNGVTNLYTVRAHYDYPSAPLTPAFNDAVTNGVPQALVTRLDFDGSQNYSDDWKFDLAQNQQTNGTLAYFDNTVTPWVENGVASVGDPGIGTWTGPTMYALTQCQTNAIRNLSTWNEWAWVNTGGSAYYGFNYHFNWGAGLEQLAYVEVDQWLFDEGAPASVDMSVSPYTISLGSDWLLAGAPSASFKFRAAVRSGGQWYVSDAGALSGEIGVTRIEVQDTLWAALTATPGTDMSVGAFTEDHTALTAVDAVGWFFTDGYRLYITHLEILESKELPSYDYWASESGLTNGIDGATDDPDLDGLTNEKEYAFGGDPMDDQSVGTLPAYSVANDGGTDGFLVVHHEQRDPKAGILYSLEMTDNLTIGTFAPDATTYVGEGDVDYYWKAVTNFVPMDIDTKFITLDIE